MLFLLRWDDVGVSCHFSTQIAAKYGFNATNNFKSHRFHNLHMNKVDVFCRSALRCFSVTILCMNANKTSPVVSVIMGSTSDLPTMRHAADVLAELGIDHEVRIVSAHRTPGMMTDFAQSAKERGVKVIIAGAGGAAHLPGMVAANTILPVIGVPVESSALSGLDSLLSIVQMPRGVPVATVAIGRSGAVNAGLLAAQIIGTFEPDVQDRLERRRADAAAEVEAGTHVDITSIDA